MADWVEIDRLEEWHWTPFPEHFAEVMETAGLSHSVDVLPADGEVSHRWYWETQTVYHDGMAWNTSSCIWFPREAPTGPYYVKNEWCQWAWVDPRHPRCWSCGQFFSRDPHHNRPTGPCPMCDGGDDW